MAKPKTKREGRQGELFNGKNGPAAGGPPSMMPPSVSDAPLADEAQRRYLTYALSVITARAIPDVRDGMKPVQRRILYAMNELGLSPDAKYRKCALIVGEVLGKFHPHGDTSVYDALVRLAQAFTMRGILVDGRGNFGSADGDAAAAYRYTEARLAPLARELLGELDRDTVAMRANFDNTRSEPIVLPARFPSLLVNGSQGIAVGLATSIPPHNLGETIDGAIALIDDPSLTSKQLLKYIKGPDFPTGGELVTTRAELGEIYANGQGSLRLRAEWKVEESKKANPCIVVTAIPYSVERRAIVEKVAEVIVGKKLNVLTDVRDESTDETRIVLEIRKDADPQLVMAYLMKHTPLATNVQINLTCLVPAPRTTVSIPARLDLQSMLRHFLDFRLEVVTRRIQFDLAALERRIHVLEGFVIVFDALDEVIRIIRKSEGKKDAAEKLTKRFGFSAEQVEAILELKLYRLAQLEINVIREELGDKKKEANRLSGLLRSEASRWKLVRAELHELRTQYADPRRTRIVGGGDEPEVSAETFIVEEDAMVLLSQQGWVKRQREVKDVSTTRVREGDSIVEVIQGSTKSCVAFFSNQGACYVSRVVDIPATSGYGDPVQKLFKLADGERIVAMIGFDPRVLDVPAPTEGAEPEPPFAIAVTKHGFTFRFSLRGHRDPSTRAGRKFARVAEGDEVIYVAPTDRGTYIGCASATGHALVCAVDEVPVFAGAGRGVMLIKLAEDDNVVAASLLVDKRDVLLVENTEGTRKFEIGGTASGVSSRGGKGALLRKKGPLLARAVPMEVTLPGGPAPDA